MTTASPRRRHPSSPSTCAELWAQILPGADEQRLSHCAALSPLDHDGFDLADVQETARREREIVSADAVKGIHPSSIVGVVADEIWSPMFEVPIGEDARTDATGHRAPSQGVWRPPLVRGLIATTGYPLEWRAVRFATLRSLATAIRCNRDQISVKYYTANNQTQAYVKAVGRLDPGRT